MFDIDLLDPDFIINLQGVKNPKRTYTIMRNQHITRGYVYAMITMTKKLQPTFIKVGRSCPNLTEAREHQVGERIVRQIAHVPGWDEEPVKSSHGLDFMYNINNYAIKEGKLPHDFCKNQLHIGIWNMNLRMKSSDFISDDEELTASRWAEASLAHQHKQIYGCLPMLNYIDPSQDKIFSGHRISKKMYQGIFQEV